MAHRRRRTDDLIRYVTDVVQRNGGLDGEVGRSVMRAMLDINPPTDYSDYGLPRYIKTIEEYRRMEGPVVTYLLARLIRGWLPSISKPVFNYARNANGTPPVSLGQVERLLRESKKVVLDLSICGLILA